MTSPIPTAALAAVAALTLGGCSASGLDAETKQTLQETLDSAQELLELWSERLGEGGGETETGTGTGTETDTAELSLIGSYLKTGTETSPLYDPDYPGFQPIGAFPGTRDTWSYSSWGVSGTADGSPLFTATISGTRIAGGPNTAFFDPYSLTVTGIRQFDNPEGMGTAAWTGKVRAYETRNSTFGTPVEGDAEVTMDLDSYVDRVDVDFTNFTRGHANMSWTDVSVRSGRFSKLGGLDGRLEGRFYGDAHQGVAGTFDHRSLKGIFGARRE